ncbi:lazarillo protein isoform X2 [Drosophila hydei]|uniref:Lazarillo protein isoform X2 n=1 Tax=Drosophila hydei TaxID=7224 RepID=A0A6J1LGZ8_DROHY|nr:lazarillo protein isoform X2 [Drosophila hydei]
MLNQVTYIAGVLVLLCGSQTLAMDVDRGTCDANMTAIRDLDMKRYGGLWYPILSSLRYSKHTPKCLAISIDQDVRGKYVIKKSEIDQKSGNVVRRDVNVVSVDATDGKYSLELKTSPEGIDVYVLDTDYETFAIQHTCLEVDDIISLKWSVIMTRDRLPTSDIILKVRNSAKLSGIDLKKVVTIPQTGCRNYFTHI